jgi:hypothetical protein
MLLDGALLLLDGAHYVSFIIRVGLDSWLKAECVSNAAIILVSGKMFLVTAGLKNCLDSVLPVNGCQKFCQSR